MTRVHVIVEGQTEESFVKNVLAAELWPHEVNLNPILLGVPGHKGGRPNYARLKKDILLHLEQDRTSCCSMMLDFYGLGGGFPDTPIPGHLSGTAKATHIERAITADICGSIPEFRPDIRFVAYIQLHEYEALLFSDPAALAGAIGQPRLTGPLQVIRDDFETPEDINNSRETAPSKRILKAFPSWRKVINGTQAAQAVGIGAMKEQCPHFRQWIEKLKSLAPQS